MKIVPVEEAVGLVLCQDITRIVPGEFKGRAFKRGHLIRKEDVAELLKLGKAHIYVWEPQVGEIHEEEAAMRLAKVLAGKGIKISEPYEGKCTFIAETRGLLRVQKQIIDRVNRIESLTVATLPDRVSVETGQALAGTRIIPFVIPEEKLRTAEQLCQGGNPALEVLPYQTLKAGVITTGHEVFHGLIEDKFSPVMVEKLRHFGAEYLGQLTCPDNLAIIRDAIETQIDQGADLVILTGGMSVDPDDLTPGAIRATGAQVITYGVPVQPGSMFMLAYLGSTTILGVPGCAMYHRTTVLDIVLPRIFVGERLVREDLSGMGVGGFCSACPVCRYPNCYFGNSK